MNFADVERNCLMCQKVASLAIPETCHHVFFTCRNYGKIFSKTLEFFFDFNSDPVCTLKGSFTNGNILLNKLIMISALAIFYTFYVFICRKKICSKLACCKMVANLAKKGLLINVNNVIMLMKKCSLSFIMKYCRGNY